MGKTILITGGSDGLGKAICEKLSKENRVIIIATNEEKIKSVMEQYHCDGMVCDVRNYDCVEETIKKIIEQYGNIDILINNAGRYINGSLTSNDISEIKSIIDVNLFGTIYCTKAILPYMKKNHSGLIININSKIGKVPQKERTIYAASKWGANGFSSSLPYEIGNDHIKVTNVFLGILQETMTMNESKEIRDLPYLNKKDIADIIHYLITLPNDVCIPEISISSIQEFKSK